jgi:hypothetical protein
MSKELEIPGDESQEVGHPPSRFLLSGSTFNAPVTMIKTGVADFSYTNYGQHASGGGRIDNYSGGTLEVYHQFNVRSDSILLNRESQRRVIA